MPKDQYKFISVIVLAAIQIVVILPTMLFGYTLLASLIQIESLVYHYLVSGVLGVLLGTLSTAIINKKYDISKKAINYYGASAGIFGMMSIMYMSWLISPAASWIENTVLSGGLDPGNPMNIWISAFVYYMLFNTPFVYLYFHENGKGSSEKVFKSKEGNSF